MTKIGRVIDGAMVVFVMLMIFSPAIMLVVLVVHNAYTR